MRPLSVNGVRRPVIYSSGENLSLAGFRTFSARDDIWL
jgi:hypothetical protein